MEEEDLKKFIEYNKKIVEINEVLALKWRLNFDLRNQMESLYREISHYRDKDIGDLIYKINKYKDLKKEYEDNYIIREKLIIEEDEYRKKSNNLQNKLGVEKYKL